MPTPARFSDRDRYPHGHLFGRWCEHPATPPAKSHHRPAGGRADRPPAKLRKSAYGGSQGRGDAAQMVTTVREVLLARLDQLGAEKLWPVAERWGMSRERWLEFYQIILWCLFPDECADGEEYTPDPACRTEVPPPALLFPVERKVKKVVEVERVVGGKTVTAAKERTVRETVFVPLPPVRGGLFPHPCMGVGDTRAAAFAAHLGVGRQSPAADLTLKDGTPVFTPADLARLGERAGRRSDRRAGGAG